MGTGTEEETLSSPPLASGTSLTRAQSLTRRGLLTLGVTSGALAATGGIGSAVCSVSHSMKLKSIQEECDRAMATYVRERLHSSSGAMPPEQWKKDMSTTIAQRVIPRNWDSDGFESEGALRYLTGDFHFDTVTIDIDDAKNGKTTQEERWLGRCGCIARHIVLEAAKNGFADVRIYFAKHPKRYNSVCPLTMHYYPVIGKNDTTGFDPRFYAFTGKVTGSPAFTPVDEEKIHSFLIKDYNGGDISLCMQSQREPIIPKRAPVLA